MTCPRCDTGSGEHTCQPIVSNYEEEGVSHEHQVVDSGMCIICGVRQAPPPAEQPLSEAWTPEKVKALNRYQNGGWMHPFTCGNHCGETLVATIHGWICPTCDYRQDWYHSFMLQPAPPWHPHSTPAPAAESQTFEQFFLKWSARDKYTALIPPSLALEIWNAGAASVAAESRQEQPDCACMPDFWRDDCPKHGIGSDARLLTESRRKVAALQEVADARQTMLNAKDAAIHSGRVKISSLTALLRDVADFVNTRSKQILPQELWERLAQYRSK